MRKMLNRRTLLRGTGVAMSLPMLEAMIPIGRAANRNSKPVKRFVCLSNNYGVYQKAFFPDPTQVGKNYDIPETLKSLEKHRKDFTVFQNLDHGFTGGHEVRTAPATGLGRADQALRLKQRAPKGVTLLAARAGDSVPYYPVRFALLYDAWRIVDQEKDPLTAKEECLGRSVGANQGVGQFAMRGVLKGGRAIG